VAGTIAEIGEGVTGWNVGDAVVAFLPLDADGAAAQYALVPTESLAAAPTSVPLADAAALPEPALTAWQALFEIAGLTAGQSVLINGASGAVGGYAVQLAKHAGAVVTATAKARDAERLRGLGADRIVDYFDYTHSPIDVEGAPFDVVLNLVSTTDEQTEVLIGVVADGGFHVGTMVFGPQNPGRGVRSQRVFVRSDAAQLAGLVSRVDDGQLRIEVADRRPLEQAAAVHDDSDSGRLHGKTILIPAE
jgi:NADPH:quinone reductase-like Zn-dependent oxidoreductase